MLAALRRAGISGLAGCGDFFGFAAHAQVRVRLKRRLYAQTHPGHNIMTRAPELAHHCLALPSPPIIRSPCKCQAAPSSTGICFYIHVGYYT